jgi:hypothetical protein
MTETANLPPSPEQLLAMMPYAAARPAPVGRTLIVVTTDLTDDQERLVAQTSQAQATT